MNKSNQLISIVFNVVTSLIFVFLITRAVYTGLEETIIFIAIVFATTLTVGNVFLATVHVKK